ncbi:MAG: right-handed parallel beta-helix repeat-containing protein [Crocinitomicaceae bacterium]|nr:right-handed parallel beta-helix repeat-containing protein [Crocinitomicaceae bacterium]
MSSCKKPLNFSKSNLSFSQDTIIFDTVFTTIGSVTKRFKIYNADSKPLKIDEITLLGGSNSNFRINVDGVAGTYFSDLELASKDSLFIFVEVTVDPNNGVTPMIVEDRIQFLTNDTDQFVELVAWGQDAYFHYSYISEGIFDLNSGIWANDKPHVIYGAAIIDEGETLEIQGGTDIYMHKNALLYNYKGTLNINGVLGNEVTIQGDRMEAFYDDVPGQYYGIYIVEAKPSTINYAIIKNATSGIHINGSDPTNPIGSYTTTVTNTQIYNSSSYGIFLYNGEASFAEAGRLKAENSVISKSGVHALLVLGGGNYNMNHCDLLGYSTSDGVGAAVGVSNYYGGTGVVRSINEGTITNSVLYGNQSYEFALDTVSDPALTLNFHMENNLIKSDEILIDPSIFIGDNYWNEAPVFKDINGYDYTFWSTSALRDRGNILFPRAGGTDLNGVANSGLPDIGAYEY